MVEMVVMLSIVTIISAMVLFSFTGLSEGGALNRSSRELALALRRAQDMALVVNQVEVGTPPVSQIPPAVGIKLSRGATDYKIFADLNPRDNKYTSSDEDIGAPQILERNTRISAIYYYDAFSSRRPVASAHIIFAAPEAVMSITDESGSPRLGEKLEVELITPTRGTTKKITVRTSGQINIK